MAACTLAGKKIGLQAARGPPMLEARRRWVA